MTAHYFPLKNPGSTTQDFSFVVERVQRRLAGWKANRLSFASQIVLAQSVLATIPAYVMRYIATKSSSCNY